jgi:NADPH:quinone reductase-like Zn-dependent oxidoreductase
MMQAMVYTQYGPPDVLQLKEIAKPVPGDHDVLVKVVAAAAAAGDWHLLRGEPFIARLMVGLFRPKYHILGADVAGRVEGVGRHVTQFKPGDKVFGDLSNCGFGAFAEYALAPERALAPIPTNFTFEQAAALPVSSITALQALRDAGQLQPGQRVVINGASGGVGTFAVQLAKSLGAHVTAVCSTGKMEMARQLGADEVIDRTQEDFTQRGERYDLILAVNGYHPLSAYQRALTPKGTYVMAGGTTAQMFEAMLLGPLRSKRNGQRFVGVFAKPNERDLLVIKELAEAGKVVPVISQRFPLHQVADAIRHVEAGHAAGKVVIEIGR